MAAIGIDGLVLALGFAAGEKAGLLLPVEVLFLGLTLVIGLTAGVILLLPVGTLLAWPIAMLPQIYLNGFLSSG
jgi:ZIP family zinc transporter